MNYSQFIIKMKESIQENLGEAASVDAVSVQKNNGILLQGITIRRKGEKIVPTLYLEKYYKDYLEGKDFEDILAEFLEVYEQYNSCDTLQGDDFDFLKSYEKVKKCLAVKLVNREKNSAMLADMPYVDFLNMAIIFYCLVDSPAAGTATIVIKNNHMEYWQVNVETLYQDALKNVENMLPGEIRTMEEVLCGMIMEEIGVKWEFPKEGDDDFPKLEGFMEKNKEGIGKEGMGKEGFGKEGTGKERMNQEKNDDHMPLLVLTNKRKCFGASCILYRGLLEKFSERLGQGFYILPSSIHEVILLPENYVKHPDRLMKMVSEVNETQLALEDVLTDSVYYYERKTGRISVYDNP